MKNQSAEKIFEQLPEDRRRKAQELHQRLMALLQNMEQNRARMVSTFAKLFGAPKETNRERVIWNGIVALASASPLSVDTAVVYFKGLVWLCTWRLEGEPPDFIDDLSCFADLVRIEKFKRKSLEQGFGELFPGLQAQLRQVLSWLVAPNSYSASLKQQALAFLFDNASDSVIDFSLDAVDDFDETGNRGYPFFYWKTVTGYQSIASPIARFIYDQLEKYHADGVSRAKTLPIVRCKRPECAQFVVPRRATKEFCSDSCRTLYRQKTKPHAHAKYMRDYRAQVY